MSWSLCMVDMGSLSTLAVVTFPKVQVTWKTGLSPPSIHQESLAPVPSLPLPQHSAKCTVQECGVVASLPTRTSLHCCPPANLWADGIGPMATHWVAMLLVTLQSHLDYCLDYSPCQIVARRGLALALGDHKGPLTCPLVGVCCQFPSQR